MRAAWLATFPFWLFLFSRPRLCISGTLVGQHLAARAGRGDGVVVAVVVVAAVVVW